MPQQVFQSGVKADEDEQSDDEGTIRGLIRREIPSAAPKVDQVRLPKTMKLKGDTSDTSKGYHKKYVLNEETGRPNQIFICAFCGVLRYKLTKINRHLNIHRRKSNWSKVVKDDSKRETMQS